MDDAQRMIALLREPDAAAQDKMIALGHPDIGIGATTDLRRLIAMHGPATAKVNGHRFIEPLGRAVGRQHVDPRHLQAIGAARPRFQGIAHGTLFREPGLVGVM